MHKKEISVIMPVYNQGQFISRAITSLLYQTFTDWELIIVNDFSEDETAANVKRFLSDHRIKYVENTRNLGLGASMNKGLELVSGTFIAYLPADDLWYKEHLASLHEILSGTEAVLAYSSFIYNYNRKSHGVLNNEWYQPVQVLHKNNGYKWVERAELESNDLNRIIWNKIPGEHIHSEKLTCEWVDHPHQRHKIMQEPIGGINTFRSWYKIQEPLVFHTTYGNLMDEKKRYERFRKAKPRKTKDSLKILIVGELAYNPERILALEERGHELYGLWMKDPYWYNYVGPLPFGNIRDICYENWREEVARIKPDVIYALLNFQAVPLAHEVMMANTGIPFVWHFKEGPTICREKGTWTPLLDLYTKSDGVIYTSTEMKIWFDDFLPANPEILTMVMDGDLAKKEWFDGARSPLISQTDGAFHTLVAGRPIGLHPHNVVELAKENIHLHFYGDFTQGQWLEWIEKTHRLAPGYLHIHPNVDQENWVTEFSRYDAAWLHYFESENNGELTRANWDDLNIPARMATYALAGVPMLQKNNDGHIVAIQSIVKEYNMGLFFNSMSELRELLSDQTLMNSIRKSIWEKRHLFTFDAHADRLIDFFRKVISQKQEEKILHVAGPELILPGELKVV